MNAYGCILEKQIQWALNSNIELIGSKGDRGRKSYTSELNENLFLPLSPHVRESFEKGDGNEIKGSLDNPAKMQAVHSSSALGVNIFHYWQKVKQVPLIAAACGFCQKGNNTSQKIVFEDKYPIDNKFQYSPNIDVVIYNSGAAKVKRFAVKCKFSEAYGGGRHSGLSPKYRDLDIMWDDIPGTYDFAKTISPDDNTFRYLHSAQLVKHILGLKNEFGKEGFRLLYLWYDVLGKEGSVHRNEIEAFSAVVKSDGIKFHALSYQELIVKLSNEYRTEHGEYIRYISNRYL